MIFTVEILSVNDRQCHSRPWRIIQHNFSRTYFWAKNVLANEPLDEDIIASSVSMRNPCTRYLFLLSFQLSRKVQKIFGVYTSRRRKAAEDESLVSSDQNEEDSVEDQNSNSSDSQDDQLVVRNQETGAVAGLKYLWTTRKINQREKYS